MSKNFCDCPDCKKAHRKGLAFGQRIMGFWTRAEYGKFSVDAYVRHPRFAKGRARKERNAHKETSE